MSSSYNMYFEFREWKECFASWHKLNDRDYQLVISTHPYTSGYYIEFLGKKLTPTDICYVGKEVGALEKRIIKEHDHAKNMKRGVLFTI